MKFINKNILIISPEPWDHIFVSKHHYAIHLALRNNRVYFLGPPTSNESLRRTEFENLFILNYKGFPQGLRLYPRILQGYFIRKKFKLIQQLAGVEFNVVWSFDNSVFFDFSHLPDSILKIGHIVDLNQNFQTKKAAQTADFCFCTSEVIKQRLLRFNSRVFKINHGFNTQISNGPVGTLPGKAKIKAVYAGNLAIDYIDWPLLLKCVDEQPGTDFIFIGPGSDDPKIGEYMRAAARIDNCFFTGSIRSQQLHQFYAQADVLLLCYKQEFQDGQVTNPHKMMEYLGSGKMIVCTRTSEYRHLHDDGLILMSSVNNEYSTLLQQTVRELGYWNSEQKRKLRMDFAYSNTYDKQIERVEEVISRASFE